MYEIESIFFNHAVYRHNNMCNVHYLILHSPAYEDGTDSEFRNVGN